MTHIGNLHKICVREYVCLNWIGFTDKEDQSCRGNAPALTCSSLYTLYYLILQRKLLFFS